MALFLFLWVLWFKSESDPKPTFPTGLQAAPLNHSILLLNAAICVLPRRYFKQNALSCNIRSPEITERIQLSITKIAFLLSTELTYSRKNSSSSFSWRTQVQTSAQERVVRKVFNTSLIQVLFYFQKPSQKGGSTSSVCPRFSQRTTTVTIEIKSSVQTSSIFFYIITDRRTKTH